MTFSIAKTGAAFAVVLLLLGCAHKQEFFAAAPIPASENSRKALTQMLREQLIQAEPLQEVEVTDVYFKCTYVET